MAAAPPQVAAQAGAATRRRIENRKIEEILRYRF